MAAKLIINLKDPLRQRFEAFCQRFPLFSMVVMQAVMAVVMLTAVAAIALAGGTVIWICYRASGLL